ncbi:DUF5080 family protein [Staphylococcus chromogenes]|uniref:DUF5080 family protein n=1 Tax=Staphylococcus chromogenes TaxID=46126 RepID=UPI000D03D496|nr:DUF5080 family protein [Staphylococcus chromogenes]MCE5044126.1 DUF5080 family protein [Staphylococcus chromogenes]MDT0680472.1 DUF5080 family protein [Staphylococcus chromogenes]MDT0715739.1 DUF5080 family protein [Staphylococcus chromogenes]MDT0735939.1 DUF5080 family protein [Staphylococcus chromogenes]MDT0749314.1 DUF5080 family protein [Staphylococcus chromogenes]
MIYIVLIGLFVVFYAAIMSSLFKIEGGLLISLLIDLGIIIALVVFYVIGGHLELHDLHNYLMFTYFGSYIYIYFTIKTFWIKPRLLKYMVEKDQDIDQEQLEVQESDLRSSRIRSIYYFIISLVLMWFTHIHMHPLLQEDLISVDPVIIFIGFIITIIWLILDIYRKIKYGVFLFKTIVPLVVTLYIFINSIVLYLPYV